MPAYIPPRSDLERAAFLHHAASTGQADAAAGNNYLSQETLIEVARLAAALSEADAEVASSQSQRSRELRQRREALLLLAVYVRDFWVAARRRARRLGQPPEVFIYFALPLAGDSPKPTRLEEWLALAGTVARGDAEAVAAGYPAMCNPSAAEITAVLATAHAAAEQASAADRRHDQAQEQMAQLRAEADRLIRDIIAELRFTLRRKDAASRRRIMRTYGAAFTYYTGEAPDPDDPHPRPAEERE